jgi:hypothetical protein
MTGSSRFLLDGRFFTLCFGWTCLTTSSCITTHVLLLVFVLGARGSSSPNSANVASFLLFLCSLIHSYSERQLGLFDGLVLGLRLGTSEGLRPGMPFRFLDRLVLGLRLGTRDAFRLSDWLKLVLRVCPGLQLGTDVWRDVVERQNMLY